MKTYLDCVPCFLRQALGAARLLGVDDSAQEQVLRRVLAAASTMDMSRPPPEMGREIHRVLRETSGCPDPYAELKARYNALALGLLEDLRAVVREAPHPLEAAVRLAIAGNIIDFGAPLGVDDAKVRQTVESCLQAPLRGGGLPALERALDREGPLLYLADNAGEIVFDRLLLERLPAERLTVVVRSGPVINDATVEDARVAGLTGWLRVRDSGQDAPGTVLEACSDDFLEEFWGASVVIAKGQGNFETLDQAGREIFFLFMAKCAVAAEHAECEIGDLVLLQGGGAPAPGGAS